MNDHERTRPLPEVEDLVKTPAVAPANGNGTPTRFRRYELKLVLDRTEAERVRAWASTRLDADRFSPGGAPYLVHSLYLDTQALDIYNRTWDEDGTKYRIRRYGDEQVVWLERKRRKGILVRKRRARWSLDRLPEILSEDRRLDGWEEKFRDRIRGSRLGARLLISYPRSAWTFGKNGRLTLDWGVEARRPAGDRPFDLAGPAAIATTGVVLELKYDDERPPVFDEVLEFLGREAGSFSKYSHGVEASGMAVARRARKPSAGHGTAD